MDFLSRFLRKSPAREMIETGNKNTPVTTTVVDAALKTNTKTLSQYSKGKPSDDSDSSLDYGSASDTENLGHDQGLTSPIKISEESGSERKKNKSFLSATSTCESLDTSGASVYEDTENIDPSYVFDQPRPKIYNALTESFESPNISIHGSTPTLIVNSVHNKSITSLDSLDKTIVEDKVKEHSNVLSVSSNYSESMNKSVITNSEKSYSVVEDIGVAETNLSKVPPTDVAAEAISELETVVDAVTNCFLNNIVSEVKQHSLLQKNVSGNFQILGNPILNVTTDSDVEAIKFESVLVSDKFGENQTDEGSNGSIIVNDPIALDLVDDVEIDTFVNNQEAKTDSEKDSSYIAYNDDYLTNNIIKKNTEKSAVKILEDIGNADNIKLNKISSINETNVNKQASDQLSVTNNIKGHVLNESVLLCNNQNNSNTSLIVNCSSLINSTVLDETIGGTDTSFIKNDKSINLDSTLVLLNSIESIIEESSNNSKNSINSQIALSSSEIKFEINEPLSNISSSLPSLKSSTDSIGVIESREGSVPPNYQSKDSLSVDFDFDQSQDFVCGSIDSIGICFDSVVPYNSDSGEIDYTSNDNSLVEKRLIQENIACREDTKVNDSLLNCLHENINEVLDVQDFQNDNIEKNHYTALELNVNSVSANKNTDQEIYTEPNLENRITEKQNNSVDKNLEHLPETIANPEKEVNDQSSAETITVEQVDINIINEDVESSQQSENINDRIDLPPHSITENKIVQFIETSDTGIGSSQEIVHESLKCTVRSSVGTPSEGDSLIQSNIYIANIHDSQVLKSNNLFNNLSEQIERPSVEGRLLEEDIGSEKSFQSSDCIDSCIQLRTIATQIEPNKISEKQEYVSDHELKTVLNNSTSLHIDKNSECININKSHQIQTSETIKLNCAESQPIPKIKEDEFIPCGDGELSVINNKSKLSLSIVNEIEDSCDNATNDIKNCKSLADNCNSSLQSNLIENKEEILRENSDENINTLKTDSSGNSKADLIVRENFITNNISNHVIPGISQDVSGQSANNVEKIVQQEQVIPNVSYVTTNEVKSINVEEVALTSKELNKEINSADRIDEKVESDISEETTAYITKTEVENNLVNKTDITTIAAIENEVSNVNGITLVDEIIESNIKTLGEIAVNNCIEVDIEKIGKSDPVAPGESIISPNLEFNKILFERNMSTDDMQPTEAIVKMNQTVDNPNEVFKVPSANSIVGKEPSTANPVNDNSSVEFETSCKISETPVKDVKGMAKKKTNLNFHQGSVDIYENLDLDQISDPFKPSNKMRMSPTPDENNIDTFNEEIYIPQKLNETMPLSKASFKNSINNVQNFDATFNLQHDVTLNGNHIDELHNTRTENNKAAVKNEVSLSNAAADHVFVKPVANSTITFAPAKSNNNGSDIFQTPSAECAPAMCSTQERGFSSDCDLMGLSPCEGNSSEGLVEIRPAHDVFSPPNMHDELMDVDEDMPSEDLFSDPAAIEYLLNRGSSIPAGHQRRDYSKESLFVKFDPLVSATTSSTGFVTKLPAGLRTPRELEHSGGGDDNSVSSNGLAESCSSDSSSSAAVMNKTIQSGIMSTGSEQALLNLSIKETSHHIPVEKPTQVVTPAINRSQSQAASQLPNRTPPNNSQKGASACSSPALLAIDRLISLAPATPPPPLPPPPPPPQSTNGMNPEVHSELVRVKELWTAEVSASHVREAELELRLGELERRLAENEDREKTANLRLKEVTTKKNQMSVVVEEYERSIASLTHEREALRRQWEAERAVLGKERDEATQHLAGVEHSFNDVHAKYERSKAHIAEYRANADSLKRAHAVLEDSLRKQEARYDALRQHAMAQIEKLNQEMEVMKRAHDLEVAKMMALLKKSELTVETLQENIAQKNKENEHLTEICNGLIQKMSN